MKKHIVIGALGALALSAWVSGAKAQSHEVVTSSGPNRALLNSGLFALGVPYVASVVVATTSDHPGDNNLYFPTVGPWIDLGARGGCGGAGQPACDTETGYKALLIVDGIVQGIGSLEIVGAFLFPETRTISTAANEPHIVLAPAQLGRGAYGLSALGIF
jgi:hypothetical protein